MGHRVVWAEIDYEAQKGKPLPSDHAPLIIDIDNPGHPCDAGWFQRIRELQRAFGTSNDPVSVNVRSGLVQESLRLINRKCLAGAHERERKT